MSKLDNLLKRRIRKTPKMLPMMKTLPSQSMLLLLQNQLLLLQSQLSLLLQLHQLLLTKVKLNGVKLILNNLPKQLNNHCTHHSLLVISNKLTLFQTTSHHPKKTPSRVDMLLFFSSLLPNKNQCTQSMKTSAILIHFILTLKVSNYSLKTLESVLQK